ncbi:PREDICTED: mitochondrial import receptor subunit TOM20 homolog, partial [Drosophila arizonae]|uniref:Mitochondrial import receptor subunit TOM20 homolog n=1 Tax=Drosophila arizonae TaxID=7263 RepID=A0ABM1PZS5_DROAR
IFRYFLQEIQLGETLIARGDFESGVEHLANAIVVCGQPARLLQVLQSSLPAQVFAMLIIKMQEFGNRPAESSEGLVAGTRSSQNESSSNILETSGSATVDDLE